jgi:Helix-turn-helix domain
MPACALQGKSCLQTEVFLLIWNAMDRNQLAEILRVERARRSLSLREVADCAGVSISVIWGLEQARRDVRYDTLSRVLNFYGKQLNVENGGG